MQFHGWQTQFLRDLRVSNLACLFESHAAHEFGEVARRSDGGTAPEGFEFYVADGLAVGVDFDLEFHYVAAGGGADEACETEN